MFLDFRFLLLDFDETKEDNRNRREIITTTFGVIDHRIP